MIGAREMNVQLATRGMERADTAASGPLALQSKGQHGDRVPVSEPWMPQNGGTPWLQEAIRCRRGYGERGGPTLPPPVLRNEAICNVEENAFIWLGENGL